MKRLSITLSLILSMLWVLVISGCSDKSEKVAMNTEFAQCITDAGFKMYWANTCPHCKDQKEMFWIASFEAIDYVECTKQQTACDLAWIDAYPTWIWNWYRQSGVHSFEKLAEVTWCKNPEINK